MLRIGRFELVDGGTIFLDEIGDLLASTQVKLLRVIQERQFERLGGTKAISVDVRMVSATNRNLEQDIQDGALSEDLFLVFRRSLVIWIDVIVFQSVMSVYFQWFLYRTFFFIDTVHCLKIKIHSFL